MTTNTPSRQQPVDSVDHLSAWREAQQAVAAARQKRTAVIARMRQEGITYRGIAAILGISATYARDLLSDNDGPAEPNAAHGPGPAGPPTADTNLPTHDGARATSPGPVWRMVARALCAPNGGGGEHRARP